MDNALDGIDQILKKWLNLRKLEDREATLKSKGCTKSAPKSYKLLILYNVWWG
jgi:hypothetical protein